MLKLFECFRTRAAYAAVNADFTEWFIDNAIDILVDAAKNWASKSSIDEVISKAESGNAEAQFVLGLMFYFETKDDSGEFKKFIRNFFKDINPTVELKKDYGSALKWLRRAAEQDYTQAQFALGNMYCNGYGTERNYSEAFEWYKKASEKGFADAEYNLGTMCRFGAGVQEDKHGALKWYRKASEHDSVEAQYVIGDMYYYGEGVVPQDKHEALNWYLKSAENGYAKAQYKVGIMYKRGRGTTCNDSEGIKWLQKSAEQNYAPAQFQLAEIYWLKDKSEGERLYLQAAENGYAPAQVVMGIDKGNLTEEGADWFRRAAEQGYAKGQYFLGLYYENYHNDLEAVKWYRKASEQGYADAQWHMALNYQYGTGGVNQNYELAYTYYYLAYLCSGDDDTTKSFSQSSMQELEGKGFFNRILRTAQLSSSQVKKAKQDAQRMFDEIQEHKEQEKRRNITLRSEVKREHINVLRDMKEKEAAKKRISAKDIVKMSFKAIIHGVILFSLILGTILFLAFITNKK